MMLYVWVIIDISRCIAAEQRWVLTSVSEHLKSKRGNDASSLPLVLGYPDSNQERQDQNLQCYHYTIPQSIRMFEMPSRIRLQKYILFCFLPKEKLLFSPFTAKNASKVTSLNPSSSDFYHKRKKEHAPTIELGHILFFSFEVQPRRDSALLKIFIEDCKPRTSHSPDLLQALRSSTSRRRFHDWPMRSFLFCSKRASKVSSPTLPTTSYSSKESLPCSFFT